MTVPSYAAGADRDTRAWAMLARIESIGTIDGLYTLCSAVPEYGDDLFLPVLTTYPSPVTERARRGGGMPEAGAVEISFVDLGDFFSQVLRTDRGPCTSIVDAISASATSFELGNSAAWDNELPTGGGFFFIDGEAITYDSRIGYVLMDVTRGALGTTATSHVAGAPVYLSTPYLRSRRLSLYMVPLDGEDASTELLLGEYRISDCSLNPDNLSEWTLGGPSQLRHLARRMCVHLPPPVRVVSVTNSGNALQLASGPELGISVGLASLRPWSSTDRTVWLQVSDGDRGGEVLRCSFESDQSARIEARGQLGSDVDSWPPGTVLRQIVSADTAYGDIRVSPGPNPSESRTAGTWNRTAHWVDILLAFMTSSSHPDDGLELVNHRGTGGLYSDGSLPDLARSNWSALQIGYGIGIPANLIDFASFVAVRARTPAIEFTYATAGLEPLEFGEFAHQFLAANGAFLVTTSAGISLALPRIPLTGETLTEWTLDDILSVRSIAKDMGVTTSVTYKVRAPHGGEQSVTLRAVDMGLLASRGLLATDESDETIEAPGLHSDSAGVFLVSTAGQKLSQTSLAVVRTRLLVDGGQWDFVPGDLVAVTHPGLPNLDSGVRGWEQMTCQILEKRGPYIDAQLGSVLEYELIAYASNQRSPRVAQAAVVVSSTLVGSDREVTVAANRYSTADTAALLGLPTSDAAAFAVGNFVQEYTRALVAVGAAREVLATGANTVTIEGSGAPSAGNVLTTATYSQQVAAQQERYASLATLADLRIDAVDFAHRYGGR